MAFHWEVKQIWSCRISYSFFFKFSFKVEEIDILISFGEEPDAT